MVKPSISILLILFSLNLNAQKTIIGIVNNLEGTPLENVGVHGQSKDEMQYTNDKGEYNITVDNSCQLLHFIYENKKLSERIDNRTIINKTIVTKSYLPDKSDYRFSFMLNGGGPNIFASLSFSTLIGEYANIEAGIALGKFHLGSTVFINSLMTGTDFTPYVGLHWSYYEEFMGPTTFPLYFPAGIRYLNDRGTSISLELAYLKAEDRFLIKSPIWGGIKIGKYF